MEAIIEKIQAGALPNTAILENLKMQVYANYAREVVVNRCTAAEASARISNGSVYKPLTASLLNNMRSDVSLGSPFRRIHPKLKKTTNPKILHAVKEIERVNNENNAKLSQKKNEELLNQLKSEQKMRGRMNKPMKSNGDDISEVTNLLMDR